VHPADVLSNVVSTQQHDLVGLSNFDFGNDVCRLSIGKKLRAHFQTQHGMVTAIIHALQSSALRL
jgi:hypothetical protein